MPDFWRAAAGGKEVSQEDLKDVAQELLSGAGDSNVWLFYGEMGSGKTTLIKAIGRERGVTDVMSSPTFSLVHEYAASGGRPVYHFDFYRLNNEKEILDIGAEEYFTSGNLCLIEWPEKLGSLTPQNSFKIRISSCDDHHRKIDYQRS